MDYREKRRLACQSLFSGFHPDYSSCRNPDQLRAIRNMAADGMYSHEIAELLGVTAKSVQKTFRRYEFPKMHNFFPPLQEERHGWKGGIKRVKGYLYQRTPEHPHASKHGKYVAIHRLVIEESLGRYLLPTEVVDHIDGDTANNDPSNLRVFASNAGHLRETLAGKVPKWSDEGLKSLARARSQPRKRNKVKLLKLVLTRLRGFRNHDPCTIKCEYVAAFKLCNAHLSGWRVYQGVRMHAPPSPPCALVAVMVEEWPEYRRGLNCQRSRQSRALWSG
jgi:hypothetical protein